MAEAAADPDKRRLRRGLLLALKCALAAALVTWLWRSGRLDFRQLARVDLGGAMLGVVAGQVIAILVPMVRWGLLVEARDLKLSLRQITQIGLISYFASLILPAAGGQEAVRLYYARRVKPGRGPDILATLVLDRFVGLVGLCAFALGAGVLLLTRTRSPAVADVVGFAAALLIGLGGVIVFLLRAKPKRLRGLIERSPRVSALFRSLEAFHGQRGVLLISFGLSCIAHVGNCISMFFAFLAIDVPVPFVEVSAISPLVTLTSSVPVTPLGIGVADAVADRLFGMLGTLHGADVTMLVRGVTAVACLACGLAYLVPVPEGPPLPAP
jgi:glycosyltransferase 2 family protein